MTTRWEVTKAVRASDLPAPSRLVMFVLADVAEVGTAEIPEKFTPSLTVLSRETGLGRSTVARHLDELERDGWVERLRPDVEAARLKGERTRYRLLVPSTAVGPGVVPEGDQVVPERDQGSPGAGLDLVPERDHPSPAAGRNKRSQISSDQTDLFTVTAPSATAAEEKPTAERPENAQTLLGELLDLCTERKIVIPARIRGQYAKGLKNALDEGFEPDLIRRAYKAMIEAKKIGQPSLLTNFLVDQQQPQTNWSQRDAKPNGRSYTGPYRNPADPSMYHGAL